MTGPVSQHIPWFMAEMTVWGRQVEAAGGQQQLQEVPKLRAQKEMLEKLSRILQDENKQLKAQLSPSPNSETMNGQQTHNSGKLDALQIDGDGDMDQLPSDLEL